MYPHERSLVERFAGKPFVLLGVNTDPDRKKLKEIISKEKINWRSWWDPFPRERISTRWNVRTQPTIYVLDHKGVIRYKNMRDKALDAAIDRLMRKIELERQKDNS